MNRYERLKISLDKFMDKFNPGGSMSLLNSSDRQAAIRKCKRLLKVSKSISDKSDVKTHRDIHFLQTFA